MKISVIGTGYVGLVTGVCFADLGHKVICVDIDSERVNKINSGVPPIYEENLKGILEKNIKENRIQATTSLKNAIMNSEISFISVGTPSGLLDYIDLEYIDEVCKREKILFYLV